MSEKSEFLIYVILVLLVTGIVFFWIFKQKVLRYASWITVAVIILSLAVTWFFVRFEETKERENIKTSLSALAPTYAGEMERLNHATLTYDTPPDDPTYLSLIEAQIRWKNANSKIAAIYTYRVDSEGIIRFVVACETDYDRNGKIEGDTEARVAIGEVFSEEDTTMLDAFLGRENFAEEPTTDRWGTWVSAYWPLRDKNGKIEAVVGLDLDAQEWMNQLKQARLAVFTRSGIAVATALALLVAATSWVISRENKTKHWEAEVLRGEKTKFESLVDSISGIVFELDAADHRFTFVSKKSISILGYLPEEWLATPNFWQEKLHPEDRSVEMRCKELIAAKKPYTLDYRLIANDKRIIWISEIATILLDSNGNPELVQGILHDITDQRNSSEELERTNLALIKSSRLAGMAEVATGVLHNVGNVLNSVNVSAALVHEKIQGSQVVQLGKLAQLLSTRQNGISDYLTRDPQGKKLPEYLEKLGNHLEAQNQELLLEIGQLTRNIEHIKRIVVMQQGYAKMSSVYEVLLLNHLVEDAISMNQAAFARHKVTVTRQCDILQPFPVDRHKVLQILVNLIRNAKHAHDHSETQDKRIHIAVTQENDFACVAVMDNGIGIPKENLASIFRHGFTTRQEGHGFGLHGSANAAAEMGGSITAQSDGTNHGAAFVLRLPIISPTT